MNGMTIEEQVEELKGFISKMSVPLIRVVMEDFTCSACQLKKACVEVTREDDKPGYFKAVWSCKGCGEKIFKRFDAIVSQV